MKFLTTLIATLSLAGAAMAADLTDPAGVARVVRTGRDALGSIEILVTNTGGPPPGLASGL